MLVVLPCHVLVTTRCKKNSPRTMYHVCLHFTHAEIKTTLRFSKEHVRVGAHTHTHPHTRSVSIKPARRGHEEATDERTPAVFCSHVRKLSGCVCKMSIKTDSMNISHHCCCSSTLASMEKYYRGPAKCFAAANQ